jgi:hypothetical protein
MFPILRAQQQQNVFMSRESVPCSTSRSQATDTAYLKRFNDKSYLRTKFNSNISAKQNWLTVFSVGAVEQVVQQLAHCGFLPEKQRHAQSLGCLIYLVL